MKRIYLLVAILSIISNSFGQNNIAEARLLPVGSVVTVSGIVTSGDELGAIRYLQDLTAGIAIYDYNLDYFLRGDSVTLTGELDDYNNLLEIKNVTNHIVNSSGNPSPIPVVLTPGQFAEEHESELAQVNNAVFDNAGNLFEANNSYSFTANGETSSIYVRADHPLIGEVIPGNPITLVGIVSQFYANYQFLSRDINDIINNSSINIISPISVNNITTSGFDLSWSTDSAGTTAIRYGNTPLMEIGEITGVGFGTEHIISISGASPSEVFYVQAFSIRNSDTAVSNISTYITQSLSSGDVKVYFTKSVDLSVSTGTDAIFLDDLIDDTLINYINRANYSIDFTIYDFNTINISDIAGALNDAYSNGVIVRAIYDTTWSDVNLTALLSPGINAVIAPGTEEYGIMHNKFVVIDAMSPNPDEPIVWTGSTNFEDANINEFANNVVIIQDKSLAIAYTLEFDEMWGSTTAIPDNMEAKFGSYKTDNTPHEFIIGDSRVECYFSPSDATTGQILKTIQSANHELFAETMLITRYDISDAIIERNSQGISTKVLINDEEFSNSTIVTELTNELGYLFREYGEDGILHHKVLIVDPNHDSSDPIVLTGSHNWSNSAENRNDENTLIIHNAEISNIFYQEFKKRFDSGISLSLIEDNEYGNGLHQFPNPFKDDFLIKFYSDKPEKIIIEILNISGQSIYYKSHSILEGTTLLEINDFTAAPGFYILKINGLNNVYTTRIIKE